MPFETSLALSLSIFPSESFLISNAHLPKWFKSFRKSTNSNTSYVASILVLLQITHILFYSLEMASSDDIGSYTCPVS